MQEARGEPSEKGALPALWPPSVLRNPDAPFDAPSALIALSDLLLNGEPPLATSFAAAWEAAWISCLTRDPAWADLAERAFRQVVSDVATHFLERERS